MDRCDSCAFVYADLAPAEVPSALRSVAARVAAMLREGDEVGLRVRPEPEVWSALEYGCHVRDVLRVQHERLRLALREDRPELTSMRREERVIEERYNEQDPHVVAAEVEAAAQDLASAFAALDDAERERTVMYRWPERAERTLTWLGRHTVHEGEHHLRDIQSAFPRSKPAKNVTFRLGEAGGGAE